MYSGSIYIKIIFGLSRLPISRTVLLSNVLCTLKIISCLFSAVVATAREGPLGLLMFGT